MAREGEVLVGKPGAAKTSLCSADASIIVSDDKGVTEFVEGDAVSEPFC